MLTDTAIRRTALRSKPFKLADGHGLYLLIHPDGRRWWRWDYAFHGKRQTLSMGVYPEVGLSEARQRLAAGRRQLRDNVDPSAARKAAKRPTDDATHGRTFAAVLALWKASRARETAPATQTKRDGIIARYLSTFGAQPIANITAPKVLAVIQPLDDAGKRETAHEVKRIISQVLRYGVATGVCDRDCTTDLRGAIPAVRERHHAAILDPKAIGALLRRIHEPASGSIIVALALKLLPLLFVRPAELRGMEWSEIDFDAALWRIPAYRMKMRRAHLVPLSRQALALLRELQPFTGAGRYVFPGYRSAKVPMSANAMNLLLTRKGYPATKQTPHGFRAMASTRLHEMGYPSDHIEMQLAHQISGVRGVYNQALYLEQRAAMMQAWADYLDNLRLAQPTRL